MVVFLYNLDKWLFIFFIIILSTWLQNYRASDRVFYQQKRLITKMDSLKFLKCNTIITPFQILLQAVEHSQINFASIDKEVTTRILRFTDRIIYQYLNTNNVENTFTIRIMDGNYLSKNLSLVIHILSVITSIILSPMVLQMDKACQIKKHLLA